MLASYLKSLHAAFLVLFFIAFGLNAVAQSGGSSTVVTGTVVDPSGAVVPNATVEIHNPVSQFQRTTTTDGSGKFTIPNVPFNNYHLSVKGTGFASFAQDVDVRSVVPVNVTAKLKLETSASNVTVEASSEDLLENTP